MDTSNSIVIEKEQKREMVVWFLLLLSAIFLAAAIIYNIRLFAYIGACIFFMVVPVSTYLIFKGTKQ